MSNSSTSPAQPDPSIDILIIGHLTKDLLGSEMDGGYRIGGTISFATVTALCLGRKPTALTRAAPDTDLSELPPEANLHILSSPTTTTFANIYTEQGRTQFCFSQALPIGVNDVPKSLRQPKIALLGPLVGEIDSDVVRIFDRPTLVAAVPQGWMRGWDDTGRVYSKPWENALEILPHLDVLILSQEDINYDLSHLDLFCKFVPLVVLTEYRNGSTVYQRQSDGNIVITKVPPRPAWEVDPTGAGDIFATAFLLRYQEIGDPILSARFANITASFGVEAPGVTGIPSRAQVLEYLSENP